MPEAKRYCFELCTQEQAQAESIGGLKRYWVRSPQGAIDMYFERTEWPKNVEFVREVEDSDRKRMDWLQEETVDTIYLDDGRICDVRGGDLRKCIDEAIKKPKQEVEVAQ